MDDLIRYSLQHQVKVDQIRQAGKYFVTKRTAVFHKLIYNDRDFCYRNAQYKTRILRVLHPHSGCSKVAGGGYRNKIENREN